LKICWDNLEKIRYRPDRGEWQSKKYQTHFYVYKESCKNCGEHFLTSNKGLYCDSFCANMGENNPMYGKILSDEHKIKLKGEIHPMFGKKHSDKSKKKMCEAHIGENNPNWKGGISCEPYCDVWLDKDFKESIKERDGYQCLNPVCSKNSETLCVHHINYIKKDCRPINLITLCNSCNVKANSDREWHQSWYSVIIYQRYGN
jgi:hypothetical protein